MASPVISEGEGQGRLVLVMAAAAIVLASVALLFTPHQVLALAPGLFVLALVILGKAPAFGFFLIIFLVPFDAYRGGAGPYQALTISKFIGVPLVGILLVAGMLKKKTSRALHASLWPLLLLFLAVAVISAWLSQYRAVAIDEIRRLLIAYTFFALTLVFLSRRRALGTLTTVILASVTIGSLLSILGYVFKIPAFVMNVQSDTFVRGMGGARNANHFAAYVIFALPLIAHGARSAERVSGKLLYGIVFAVNVAAVILTYSRGAAIVLSLTLLLMFVTSLPRLRPHHLGLALGALAVAVVAVALLVPQSYWERQRSMLDRTDGSIARRLSYVHAARDAFKERPAIGHGIGSFGEIYASSPHVTAGGRKPAPEKARRAAHNSYLEIAIGTGLIGIAVFLAMLGGAFLSFGRGIRSLRLRGMDRTASMLAAYRLSFVSLLIFFFMLSSVYHKYLWVCLALSQVALVLAAEPSGQGEDEGADRTE